MTETVDQLDVASGPDRRIPLASVIPSEQATQLLSLTSRLQMLRDDPSADPNLIARLDHERRQVAGYNITVVPRFGHETRLGTELSVLPTGAVPFTTAEAAPPSLPEGLRTRKKHLDMQLESARQAHQQAVESGPAHIKAAQDEAARILSEAELRRSALINEAEQRAAEREAGPREQAAQIKVEAKQSADAKRDLAGKKEANADLLREQTIVQDPEYDRLPDYIMELLRKPGLGQAYLDKKEKEAQALEDRAAVRAERIIAAVVVANKPLLREARARAERLMTEEAEHASRLIAQAHEEVQAAQAAAQDRIDELVRKRQEVVLQEAQRAQSQTTQVPPAEARHDTAPVPSLVTPRPQRPSTMRSPTARRPVSPQLPVTTPHIQENATAHAEDVAVTRQTSADVVGNALRNRRAVAALVAMALLGGGGLVAVGAANQGKSSMSQAQERVLASKDVAVPKWSNFPVSVKAWQEELAKAITDPRATPEGINYVLGDGTQKDPGYAELPIIAMMLLTKGDFHSHGGLVPISEAQKAQLARDTGIAYTTPDNDANQTVQDAQNDLIYAARYTNIILGDMSRDSKWRNAFKQDPYSAFVEFTRRWKINGAKDPKTGQEPEVTLADIPNFSEAFAYLAQQWRSPKSAQFDALMAPNATFAQKFADAAKVVEAAGVLSKAEKNS